MGGQVRSARRRGGVHSQKSCNPCNPCAAKACNPCNPCGGAKVAAKDFVRPAGVGAPARSTVALVSQGKALWNDTSLSSNGLACQTCHVNGSALNATFAQAYPHKVAMATQRAGVGPIQLDEMVQFCMLIPMQAKPLKWGSQRLAALTAYSAQVQKGFNPCKVSKGACNPCNPCAAKNACSPCNPCAVKKGCNPCAAKNPCNPCNPCAVKNPCKTS
jgi:cytochrome c